MIDRGFAVVNEGTSTIKDIMSFPRLCQVSLSMDDDGQGQVRVRLASKDAPEDLVFTLPLDFSEEPPERFTSTSIIGGQCSSVWDCGDQVQSAILSLAWFFSENDYLQS